MVCSVVEDEESPPTDDTASASSSLLGRVDVMLAPSDHDSDGTDLWSGYGTDETRPYMGNASAHHTCPYHGNYDSDESDNPQILCPPPLYHDYNYYYQNSHVLTQYDSDDT